MNRRETPQELEKLLTACMEGTCDAPQSQRIERLLDEDPAAFEAYIEMMNMHAMLEWRHGIPEGTASGQWAVGSEADPQSPNPEIPKSPISNPKSQIPNPLPTIVFDDAAYQSPLSPAPLYVAHPFLFSNLFSLLVLGLGALGAWMYQVDIPQPATHARLQHPAAIPLKSNKPDDLEFVGRVTGLVDVQWADIQTATVHGAGVPLGRRYALASGQMEISYKTGAKVILQAPVTYEVDSRDGGFLSLGKLTARLEKKGPGVRGQGSEKVVNGQSLVASGQWSVASKADPKSQNPEIPKSPISNPQSLIPNPLLSPAPRPQSLASTFAVRTPTATVTDLGTEFGIEVTKDRRNRVHVFQGKVLLDSRGSATALASKYELSADESAEVEPQGRVIRYPKGHANTVAKSVHFARVLDQPQSLIAYWPMNEGQKRTAYDQSVNHIDGWLNGPATWTQGKFGSAVRIPGEGYVYCKSSPRLAIGKGDFTVALWFRAKDLTDWRWLLNYNGEGTSKDLGALVVTIHGTRLRVSLGEWFTDVINNPTIDVNETDWYHIAVVRQRSLVQGYVNGRPDGSPVTSFANLPIGSLRLGQGPHGNILDGALDDVALWNIALKPSQIKALADGTATPLNVLPHADDKADSGDSSNKLQVEKGGS